MYLIVYTIYAIHSNILGNWVIFSVNPGLVIMELSQYFALRLRLGLEQGYTTYLQIVVKFWHYYNATSVFPSHKVRGKSKGNIESNITVTTKLIGGHSNDAILQNLESGQMLP